MRVSPMSGRPTGCHCQVDPHTQQQHAITTTPPSPSLLFLKLRLSRFHFFWIIIIPYILLWLFVIYIFFSPLAVVDGWREGWGESAINRIICSAMRVYCQQSTIPMTFPQFINGSFKHSQFFLFNLSPLHHRYRRVFLFIFLLFFFLCPPLKAALSFLLFMF